MKLSITWTALLLIAGAVCLPFRVVEAATVQACAAAGATACAGFPWSVYIDAADLSADAFVSGCFGSTLASGTAGDYTVCTGAGGTSAFKRIGDFAAGDLAYNVDAGAYASLASEGYTGNTGGSSSSGGTSFDPSTLDKDTITAYFATGWFIVALGWLTGKGVTMLVQFVKQI